MRATAARIMISQSYMLCSYLAALSSMHRGNKQCYYIIRRPRAHHASTTPSPSPRLTLIASSEWTPCHMESGKAG